MRLPIKVGAALVGVAVLAGCSTPATGTASIQPAPATTTVTVTAPAPAASDVCYRAVQAARTVMNATMNITDAQGAVVQGIQPALIGASRMDSAPIEALTGLIEKSTAVMHTATATIGASIRIPTGR